MESRERVPLDSTPSLSIFLKMRDCPKGSWDLLYPSPSWTWSRLELDEWPVIGKGSNHVLQDGMVVALEPKVVFHGEGSWA